jgi:tetratricopeptide (TPR) repeat protein
MSIPVLSYEHRGKAIAARHAEAFKQTLQSAIQAELAGTGTVSPVFECLPLQPPTLGAAPVAAAVAPGAPAVPPPAEDRVAKIIERARDAEKRSDFDEAAMCFERAQKHRPGDPWIVQQFALATSRSQVPDPETALLKAAEILGDLSPETSNDPETLGVWGSVHKRLWELTNDPETLEAAIDAYERGFRLRDDFYNGINFAFLLDSRAAATQAAGDFDEAVTDAVLARRVRGTVLKLCQKALESEADPEPGGSPAQYEPYWLRATMAEAAVGLGDEAAAATHLKAAGSMVAEPWMIKSTSDQIAQLRALLASSPLHSR